MNKPGFFGRSELTAALWAFRREFVAVGLFSMVEALYRRIHEPPPPDEMKRELAEKLQ